MAESDSKKAANALKERLKELSHKDLIDTAVEHWIEDREIRKKQHYPSRRR